MIADIFADATPRPDGAMLPSRLCGIAARMLGVDGAGVGVLAEDLRVPLGATSLDAVTAERAQFTLGEGPCLTAVNTKRVVVADPERLSRLWPAYHEEIRSRTPYRSVVALPLFELPGAAGTLDLFCVDPGGADRVDVGDASDLADAIGAVLGASAGLFRAAAAPTADVDGRGWDEDGPARRRARIWVAMGIAMAEFEIDAADALIILREHAHDHGRDLEYVAEAVLSGSVSPRDLLR